MLLVDISGAETFIEILDRDKLTRMTTGETPD